MRAFFRYMIFFKQLYCPIEIFFSREKSACFPQDYVKKQTNKQKNWVLSLAKLNYSKTLHKYNMAATTPGY